MFNSHVHLDFDFINSEYGQYCVIPSIGKQNWQKITQIGRSSKQYYYAYGIHPWFVERHTQDDLDELEVQIQKNHPIAVGECGLDYAKPIDKERQKYFFEAQLKLAQIYQLPIIIHSVKATEATLDMLRKYPQVSGEVHGFSGSFEYATSLIKMGFYLGFGLPIVNPKATRLRSVVKKLPLTSLLLETDDYPNPEQLSDVAEAIAQLKQIPISEVICQCDDNATQLFGLG